MERLKLAIQKAKDNAGQHAAHPGGNTLSKAMPIYADDSTAVFGSGESTPSSRMLRTLGVPLLLLGLAAALLAFWSAKSDGDDGAPAPQVDVAAAPQSTETASTAAAADAAPPAAAIEPPVATQETPAAEPQVPLNDQVVAAVEAWRQAWAARDVPTYLEAYGKDFVPPKGATRKEWTTNRYRNVGGRKSIDVQIKELQVLSAENDRARVSFLQDYTAENYRETAQPKTLDLAVEEDGRWRIVGEWQDDPPPLQKPGGS